MPEQGKPCPAFLGLLYFFRYWSSAVFKNEFFAENIIGDQHDDIGQNFRDCAIDAQQSDQHHHSAQIHKKRQHTEPEKRAHLSKAVAPISGDAFKDITLIDDKSEDDGKQPGDGCRNAVIQMEQLIAGPVDDDIDDSGPATHDEVHEYAAPVFC